jgi:hypothetical protein
MHALAALTASYAQPDGETGQGCWWSKCLQYHLRRAKQLLRVPVIHVLNLLRAEYALGALVNSPENYRDGGSFREGIIRPAQQSLMPDTNSLHQALDLPWKRKTSQIKPHLPLKHLPHLVLRNHDPRSGHHAAVPRPPGQHGRKRPAEMRQDELDVRTALHRATYKQIRHDPCRIKKELQPWIRQSAGEWSGFKRHLALRLSLGGRTWTGGHGRVDENSGFASVQLVEDWFEELVTQVVAVAVGHEDVAVAAFCCRGCDFCKAGLHVRDGKAGEVAEALGESFLEIGGVGVDFPSQFGGEYVVTRDEVSAGTGDGEDGFGDVMLVHEFDVCFLAPFGQVRHAVRICVPIVEAGLPVYWR